MTLKNIDFKKGKIAFDSFNIDYNLPFKDQKFELGEDLLQVEYPKDYLLDLGWLSGFDINGRFVVRIIRNCDWENPLLIKETRSFSQLEQFTQEAVNYIMKLIAE